GPVLERRDGVRRPSQSSCALGPVETMRVRIEPSVNLGWDHVIRQKDVGRVGVQSSNEKDPFPPLRKAKCQSIDYSICPFIAQRFEPIYDMLKRTPTIKM